MTKKHYIMIATAFKEEVEYTRRFTATDRNDAAKDHLENVALKLCALFRGDNPNFDTDRFMSACGF